MGMHATACLSRACPLMTYMTVTRVSMQVQLQVLDPVPKEQRDLAYWETRYRKAGELFSAASAMEATADYETSLLLQAAGPSTAAEGQ